MQQYKVKAKAFRTINENKSENTPLIKRSNLATLLPLVAASLSPFALQAQPCSNNPGGNTSSCTNGNTGIDLDGTGLDMVVIPSGGGGSFVRFSQDDTWLTAGYLIGPYVYFNAYAVGATIMSSNINVAPSTQATNNPCPGEAMNKYGWLDYDAGSGQWNGGDGTVAEVLAFKKNGVPGFVEILLNDAANTATVGEYGIANSPNVPVYTAGDCVELAALLPVELIHFSGQLKNDVAMLDWSAASELSFAGYEVQRSTDGRDFHKIGWLDAKGNNNSGTTSYQFEDRGNKSNQTYYYRLKMVDINQTFEYSKAVALHFNDGQSVTVQDFAPNPVEQSFAPLRIQSNEAQKAHVLVFDAMGKVVFEKHSQIISGLHTININLENAANGNHFVKVHFEDGTSIFKRLMVVKNK